MVIKLISCELDKFKVDARTHLCSCKLRVIHRPLVVLHMYVPGKD